MRKLLPVILALLGAIAGAAAGHVLRPMTESPAVLPATSGPLDETTVIPVPNQFVIPLIDGGRVASMVILSLSLEADPAAAGLVERRLPRLQDAFLQVMFDHANAGGFHGNFTASTTLAQLRSALRETAQDVLGAAVQDVLITEYLRHDS